MTQGIENKVVVITGASSGLGEAAARLLAKEGAKLVLGARRLDRLQVLASELSLGKDAILQTDVTDVGQVRRLVDHAVKTHGRLDVIINNAGIGPISRFDALRVEDWDAMIDVNVKGVLHGIAAALPVFRAQGSGHFVNTASTAAHTIRPAMAVYSATKMAVRAISEGLRQEAGPNLRVTVITPGMTDTGFADDISNPEVRAQIAASKTDFGMPPAAIAHAMAYAIAQPPEVDVGEVIVRPTAQS